MNLTNNAFRPWKNGSHREDVLVGDKEGEPFIVRIEKDNWIPLNVLIFAKTVEDAKERVYRALKVSNQEPYKSVVDRKEKLVELFEEGYVKAEKFNKQYSSVINWDSRGVL